MVDPTSPDTINIEQLLGEALENTGYWPGSNEQKIMLNTGATVDLLVALLGEVHKLRLAVERLETNK